MRTGSRRGIKAREVKGTLGRTIHKTEHSGLGGRWQEQRFQRKSFNKEMKILKAVISDHQETN